MRNVDMGQLSYLASGGVCILFAMGWFFYFILCGDSRLAVVALTADIPCLFLAVAGNK
jgi:hypothetical protein